MGSNLTSEHDHSRPTDILLPNWALGKPAAFDISVTSPLNPKIVSVAGLSAGAAALLKSKSILRMTPNAMLLAGVVCLWSRSPMVHGKGKPWTRLMFNLQVKILI